MKVRGGQQCTFWNHTNSGSNVIRLLAEFVHLFVIVTPLKCHLLIFLLQSLDGFLRAKTLVFSMFLCSIELFLRVLELLRHSLKV